MSDAVDVAPSLLFRPAKGLISFDSSGGHQELRNAAACGADRYYDAGSVFDRLHRGRSAVSFRHSAARKLLLERPRDSTNMMSGGTPEISEAVQYFHYARPLSRGSAYCDFRRQVTREARGAIGYFAAGKLTSNAAPPLHVSHDIVDVKVHGPPAWRPSSASSVRRDDSIPAADNTMRSRPSSAASFRDTVQHSRRAESSLAGTTHRSTAAASEDERNPLGAFMATKRSISKNLTFSKAPRITF
jgi:hypothetical protein